MGAKVIHFEQKSQIFNKLRIENVILHWNSTPTVTSSILKIKKSEMYVL